MKRNPATHFRAVPTARIEGSWRAVARRLQRRRVRARTYLLAAAIALLVGIAVFPRTWHGTVAPSPSTVIETATQSQAVELPEGSRVTLAPSSRLLLVQTAVDRIRLELASGAMDVEATHREHRSFVVVARDLEIEVVGTRFHVDVSAASGADVAVQEGRVRVLSRLDPQHPRFIGAGETWSIRAAAPSFDAGRVEREEPVDAAARPAPRAPPEPPFRRLYQEGRYDEAYALVARDFSSRCDALDADALFALAETARLSGHARDAAAGFDAFRHRFRANPRAALAALELGRLELDDLDDPHAAKEAFDDAIAIQPDGFFREDADARRVQSLEALGDHDACAVLRDRYLAAYPNGSHRASVAKRCRKP